MRTPGAWVAKVMKKWCSPGSPVRETSDRTLRTTPAQGVLGEDVVADEIFCHELRPAPGSGSDLFCMRFGRPVKGSGGFCCQVPPNPA